MQTFKEISYQNYIVVVCDTLGTSVQSEKFELVNRELGSHSIQKECMLSCLFRRNF